MTYRHAACSAPGKVLLAGGYLVLDRKHTGLVFGLDARIHVQVHTAQVSDSETASNEIVVRSPQFPGSEWSYVYRSIKADGGVEVIQSPSSSSPPRNGFVETALSYGLSYISSLKAASKSLEPCIITILADKDYYSVQQPASTKAAPQSKAESGRFVPFSEPLWQVHKTGLGSSAALVTSFTAALFSYYLRKEELDITSDAGRAQLHNLAQTAHCAAQGKVGSGFDIASAVFGSCVYRRFSPSVVESVGELGSTGFAQRLKTCVDDVDKHWDVSIEKNAVAIPKGLKLIMCDVDCGSQTPGMVKQVLEWRKAKPEEARNSWRDLQAKNDDLAAELLKVVDGSDDQYDALRRILSQLRGLIREMSHQSGVPIEPPPQTKLLDACSNVEGVVGGVVPGAGGFDAVALLIEDNHDTYTRVEQFLDTWKFDMDESGSKSSGHVRLLDTKGEMEGVRIEESEVFANWV